MADVDERLTSPLYTPAEAARLLGLSVGRVRRWLFGYEYDYRAIRRRQRPVVERDEGEERQASFLDLMELLFAKDFLAEGISLHKMRRALAEARQIFGVDHPFARRRFFTLGRSIYTEVERGGGGKNLLRLLSGGQWAIAPVIMQYAKQIEFSSATGVALRWWPLGRVQPIVVDPKVAFGSPSITGLGTKTAVIYDLYRGEGHAGPVSRWFGMERRVVEAAIRFEERLQRRAA